MRFASVSEKYWSGSTGLYNLFVKKQLFVLYTRITKEQFQAGQELMQICTKTSQKYNICDLAIRHY